MSAAVRVAVSAEDLWSVLSGVWESLLGRPASPADGVTGGEGAVSASVALHGDWEGAVTVACSPAAAESLTRMMLALPGDARLMSGDVPDAVCEVVNVIGGNVKALVEGSSRLGLPEWGTAVPPEDGALVCHLAVGWDEHVARVCVWQRAGTVEEHTGGGAR